MKKEWTKVRAKVKSFIEEEIYPVEKKLAENSDESKEVMKRITQMAKDENIWALGHPKDIGGGGMPFMDYVYINEVIGLSLIHI